MQILNKSWCKMRVLLISPRFYGLDEAIKNGLSSICDVVFFDEEIHLNLVEQSLRKIAKNHVLKRFRNYLNKFLLEKYPSDFFDKIIIIYAGAFYWDVPALCSIKNHFSKAELIYYAWDSMINIANGSKFLYLFDKKYSYDINDCKKYAMIFLPLFYYLDYPKNDIIYDCVTVFTFYINKDRNFKLINNLLGYNVKKYFHIYFKSKQLFFLNKLFRYRVISKYDKCDIKFNKLTNKDCVTLLSKSLCIVDVPMELNYGLTSRVINALHNNKKIITTNPNIQYYTFFNPNNIFIVNEKTREIPQEFFSNPFDISSSLDENFSLNSFCEMLCGYKFFDYTIYYKGNQNFNS